MNITNNLTMICKSMGKEYRIAHIAKSGVEANAFTLQNPGTGVIAEEEQLGLIFIAENEPATSKEISTNPAENPKSLERRELPVIPSLIRRIYGCLFTHARVILNGKQETLWLYKGRWYRGPSAVLGGPIDLTKQEPQTKFIALDPICLRDHDWKIIADFEAVQNLPYALNELVWVTERTQAEGKSGITITFWKQ